jgi:hypothetical protein
MRPPHPPPVPLSASDLALLNRVSFTRILALDFLLLYLTDRVTLRGRIGTRKGTAQLDGDAELAHEFDDILRTAGGLQALLRVLIMTPEHARPKRYEEVLPTIRCSAREETARRTAGEVDSEHTRKRKKKEREADGRIQMMFAHRRGDEQKSDCSSSGVVGRRVPHARIRASAHDSDDSDSDDEQSDSRGDRILTLLLINLELTLSHDPAYMDALLFMTHMQCQSTGPPSAAFGKECTPILRADEMNDVYPRAPEVFPREEDVTDQQRDAVRTLIDKLKLLSQTVEPVTLTPEVRESSMSRGACAAAATSIVHAVCARAGRSH